VSHSMGVHSGKHMESFISGQFLTDVPCNNLVFLNTVLSTDIQALPQDVCCCAYKVSSISHNDAVIGHDVLQIVQQFQWIQMLLERFL